MADKNTHEEAYYHQDESPIEEEATDYSEMGGETGSKPLSEKISDVVQNRRILVAGAIIAAILIVYYLLGPEGEQTQTQLQTQNQQEQRQDNEDQQAEETEPNQQSTVALTGEATQDVQEIQKGQAQNLDKINALISEINRLKKGMNQLTAASNRIHQSINDVKQRINNLQQQQRAWLQAQQKKKEPQKTGQSERVVFHVRAIQPGMAWLKGSNGKEIIVRRGDNIKDYGRVKMINPRRGIVATTTGAVFEYDQ